MNCSKSATLWVCSTGMNNYDPLRFSWCLLVGFFQHRGNWNAFCCSIATLAVAQNMRELYRLVLVDTPLAPYFSECITSEVRFRPSRVISRMCSTLSSCLNNRFFQAKILTLKANLLQDLDDMNIEIMRNTLYKAYLEDFYQFCQVH